MSVGRVAATANCRMTDRIHQSRLGRVRDVSSAGRPRVDIERLQPVTQRLDADAELVGGPLRGPVRSAAGASRIKLAFVGRQLVLRARRRRRAGPIGVVRTEPVLDGEIGEVFGFDGRAFGEDDGALDHVAQFADVAGPVVAPAASAAAAAAKPWRSLRAWRR